MRINKKDCPHISEHNGVCALRGIKCTEYKMCYRKRLKKAVSVIKVANKIK